MGGSTAINDLQGAISNIQNVLTSNFKDALVSGLLSLDAFSFNSGGLIYTLFVICVLWELYNILTKSMGSGGKSLITDGFAFAIRLFIVYTLVGVINPHTVPGLGLFRSAVSEEYRYKGKPVLHRDVFNFLKYNFDKMGSTIFKAGQEQARLASEVADKVSKYQRKVNRICETLPEGEQPNCLKYYGGQNGKNPFPSGFFTNQSSMDYSSCKPNEEFIISSRDLNLKNVRVDRCIEFIEKIEERLSAKICPESIVPGRQSLCEFMKTKDDFINNATDFSWIMSVFIFILRFIMVVLTTLLITTISIISSVSMIFISILAPFYLVRDTKSSYLNALKDFFSITAVDFLIHLFNYIQLMTLSAATFGIEKSIAYVWNDSQSSLGSIPFKLSLVGFQALGIYAVALVLNLAILSKIPVIAKELFSLQINSLLNLGQHVVANGSSILASVLGAIPVVGGIAADGVRGFANSVASSNNSLKAFRLNKTQDGQPQSAQSALNENGAKMTGPTAPSAGPSEEPRENRASAGTGERDARRTAEATSDLNDKFDNKEDIVEEDADVIEAQFERVDRKEKESVNSDKGTEEQKKNFEALKAAENLRRAKEARAKAMQESEEAMASGNSVSDDTGGSDNLKEDIIPNDTTETNEGSKEKAAKENSAVVNDTSNKSVEEVSITDIRKEKVKTVKESGSQGINFNDEKRKMFKKGVKRVFGKVSAGAVAGAKVLGTLTEMALGSSGDIKDLSQKGRSMALAKDKAQRDMAKVQKEYDNNGAADFDSLFDDIDKRAQVDPDTVFDSQEGIQRNIEDFQMVEKSKEWVDSISEDYGKSEKEDRFIQALALIQGQGEDYYIDSQGVVTTPQGTRLGTITGFKEDVLTLSGATNLRDEDNKSLSQFFEEDVNYKESFRRLDKEIAKALSDDGKVTYSEEVAIKKAIEGTPITPFMLSKRIDRATKEYDRRQEAKKEKRKRERRRKTQEEKGDDSE